MTPEMVATVGQWIYRGCETFIHIGTPAIPVHISWECAACGNTNLRFNHVLEHRQDKRQILVGICCATTLMEESDIPYLCETEVKRKKHWRIHYNKPGRCHADQADLEARGKA
jgi:hypothetical protein